MIYEEAIERLMSGLWAGGSAYYRMLFDLASLSASSGERHARERAVWERVFGRWDGGVDADVLSDIVFDALRDVYLIALHANAEQETVAALRRAAARANRRAHEAILHPLLKPAGELTAKEAAFAIVLNATVPIEHQPAWWPTWESIVLASGHQDDGDAYAREVLDTLRRWNAQKGRGTGWLTLAESFARYLMLGDKSVWARLLGMVSFLPSVSRGLTSMTPPHTSDDAVTVTHTEEALARLWGVAVIQNIRMAARRVARGDAMPREAIARGIARDVASSAAQLLKNLLLSRPATPDALTVTAVEAAMLAYADDVATRASLLAADGRQAAKIASAMREMMEAWQQGDGQRDVVSQTLARVVERGIETLGEQTHVLGFALRHIGHNLNVPIYTSEHADAAGGHFSHLSDELLALVTPTEPMATQALATLSEVWYSGQSPADDRQTERRTLHKLFVAWLDAKGGLIARGEELRHVPPASASVIAEFLPTFLGRWDKVAANYYLIRPTGADLWLRLGDLVEMAMLSAQQDEAELSTALFDAATHLLAYHSYHTDFVAMSAIMPAEVLWLLVYAAEILAEEIERDGQGEPRNGASSDVGAGEGAGDAQALRTGDGSLSRDLDVAAKATYLRLAKKVVTDWALTMPAWMDYAAEKLASNEVLSEPQKDVLLEALHDLPTTPLSTLLLDKGLSAAVLADDLRTVQGAPRS